MSDLGVRVGADTSGAVASFNALGTAGERELERITRALKFATQRMAEMQREQKMATQTIQASGVSIGQTANAMRMLPAQMTDVATQLAGGQSPFLILLQQGGQIKDSFGGFAPMFRGLASAITPVGLAIGAVAAVTGGATLAYWQGQKQSEEYAKAILTTGNAAGLTEGRFNGLITVINATTGASLSASRAAAQATAGAGVFGPQSFSEVATAIATYSKVSGQSADETARHFSRMADGVAKWAAEENRQRHFLTAQQYARIKALEEEGKAQEAMALTAEALNNRLKGTSDNLGFIERQLKEHNEIWAKWWDAAMGMGRAETAEEKLKMVQKRIAEVLAAQSGPFNRQLTGDGGLAGLRAQESQLKMGIERGEAEAKLKAEKAAIDQAGISATNYFGVVHAGQKTLENRNKAQDEYTRKLEDLRKAGLELPSPKQQKIDRQQLNDRFSETTSSKQTAEALAIQAAFDQRAASLVKEGISLRTQADHWARYGRAMDDTRVAMLKVDLAEGFLKKGSSAEKARVLKLAADNDASATQREQAEAGATLKRHIEQLHELATAREESARQGFIAQQMEKKSAAAEKANAADRSAWLTKGREQAGALYDSTRFAPAMAEWARTGDERVAQLGLEAKLLGYTAAEREKANEMLRIEAEFRKRIAQDPEQASALVAERDRQKSVIGKVMDDNARAARLASTGVDSALGSWVNAATNDAKNMESFVTGSLDRTADAFTKFAMTGKGSFGDLVSFMAQQWLSMQIKMQMAEWIKPGSSGGSSLGSSLGTLWAAFSGAPKLASGINYVPYDGFPAILHEGERVQTKYEAAKGGGGMVDASVRIGSIGSGVNRGEMYAAIAQAQANAERRRMRLQSQGAMA